MALPIKGQPSKATPGITVDSLQSEADPSQTYAIYLPSDYSPDQQWPILFIMDPRGRARLPLDRFKDTAEELGYIMISSYNTMSDGPEEPNVKALNAMLRDVNMHFSIDQQRYYLVGFSGTARLSWPFAYQIPDQVAGIIGFGAGTANGMLLQAKVLESGKPFSFYGGAGYSGFNYPEMLGLEPVLKKLDFPHKLVFYEGFHSWPDDSTWYKDALQWMHLQAMKNKQVPVDSAFVKSYYQESLAQIAAKGNIYEEYQGLEDLMASFEGLVTHPKQITDRFKTLQSSRGLEVLKAHVGSLIVQYRQQNVRYNKLLDRLLENDYPSSEEIMRELQISKLQQQARESTDVYTARIAQNLLELIYVKASFYTPRTLLRQQLPQRVPISLEVALSIKPPNIRTHMFYLRAYNNMNEFEAAWDHVRQLFKMGVPPEYLENDPQLKAITQQPEFQQLALVYHASEINS